jgi:hypothetical protein
MKEEAALIPPGCAVGVPATSVATRARFEGPVEGPD